MEVEFLLHDFEPGRWRNVVDIPPLGRPVLTRETGTLHVQGSTNLVPGAR